MDSSCALTESGQEVPVIMDGTAIPITDPGLASSLGPQIEREAFAGQHPPNMRARPRPRGDHRTHQVARLVAEMHLLPLPMPDGKAMLIDAAHLPITLTGGFDQQRNHLARFQRLWGALADTRCVEPMRFRQMPLRPVVLGQTAAAGLQG